MDDTIEYDDLIESELDAAWEEHCRQSPEWDDEMQDYLAGECEGL